MLDIRMIKENLDEVKRALARRGKKGIPLNKLVKLDRQRREIIAKVEQLKHRKNILSEKIGEFRRTIEAIELERLKRTGPLAPTGETLVPVVPPNWVELRVALEDKLREATVLSQEINAMEQELKKYDQQIANLLLVIPNMPHESVPDGMEEEDNVEVPERRWGKLPEFDFSAKPHWRLGVDLGILDFARAAKMTGSRFTVCVGLGAALERALINFMLDLHTREHGYKEMFPPFLVNPASMLGGGQLPKFEADLFKTTAHDFFLVPTAEVPLLNLHRDEIIAAEELPIYYTAYTACFREEAGAAGKETRGLIRQHQFNKVELFKFTTPEDSYEELEKLVDDAQEVLKRLGIVHRVMAVCTGDLGFASAKTYDIEAYFPGMGKFIEVSSCSNCGDYQARRSNIKYRPQPKAKPRFVHTLNGSGLAIGRTLAALLENYQNEDGSITIPEGLRPYIKVEKIERME